MKNNIFEENPELAKISSKGQIVIPKDYREKLHISEGNVFAVTSPTKDMLVLKKITNPMTKSDLATVKSVEDAWKEIDRGEFKESSKSEFLSDLKEW